ncbi:MAG TPA: molybdopterin converting factor subunit 1 [Gammaproteobacteria bacterium]|nr:molybdopterin converting factor subunit 1 [Gammaproteobacteria bacterium]
MEVNVKYFASLRERMGRSGETVRVTAGETVGQIWHRVARGDPPPENLLMAVNMEYADLDSPVGEGDEVAFFPPVTGG